MNVEEVMNPADKQTVRPRARFITSSSPSPSGTMKLAFIECRICSKLTSTDPCEHCGADAPHTRIGEGVL